MEIPSIKHGGDQRWSPDVPFSRTFSQMPYSSYSGGRVVIDRPFPMSVCTALTVPRPGIPSPGVGGGSDNSLETCG